MALDHSCQVQRHSQTARGLDLYSTPPVAVAALVRVETLPFRLWDPCAGLGNITNVLRAAGHEIIASDLCDYGDPSHFHGRDFLLERKAPEGCQAIVCNPPFYCAEAFVNHAVALVPLVVMLLRLAFFEGGTGPQSKHRLRARVLDEIPPARIHVFRKRLPMMHRKGWEGRKANSGMAFAWWVWDRSHCGATVIDRISWERP